MYQFDDYSYVRRVYINFLLFVLCLVPVHAQQEQEDFGIQYISSIGGKITSWIFQGGIYYVGQGDSFRIVKDSNSGKLLEIGSLRLNGSVDSIVISGSVIFLAVGSEIDHIDVSDPTKPHSLGKLKLNLWYRHLELAIRDSELFVRGGGRVEVFDITNPSQPLHTKLIYMDENTTISTKIFYKNKSASSSLPLSLSLFQIMSDAIDVKAIDEKAYVLDRNYGIYVLDITNPQDPKLIDECKIPGDHSRLTITKNHACILDAQGGFHVLDIGNSSPTLKYSGHVSNAAYAIAAFENYLYISTDVGLEIYNIRAVQPLYLNRFALKGFCTDIEITGTSAFVRSVGTYILHLDQPELPIIKKYIKIDLPPEGSGELGIDKISASNEYICELNYEDPYIYGKCRIIDIRDVNTPKIIGDINVSSKYPEHFESCLVKNKILFLAWRYQDTGGIYNGIKVYDLSKDINAIIGIYSNLEKLSGWTSTKSNIYIADGLGGLVILR